MKNHMMKPWEMGMSVEPVFPEVSKKTKGKLKQREGDRRVKKKPHQFFGLHEKGR